MSALVLPLLALLAAAPVASPLPQLLESRPADSLVGPLEQLESTRRGRDAVEAALVLGRLRYARGEYRQAAAVFARAAAHADAARRPEARYWAGLSWLGVGAPNQARAAFEEAARGDSPVRTQALLGVALSWEAARRPERALETLQALLAGDPGEAGPAALEHVRSLATQHGRPELARRAAERLQREYPRSVEAVRAARAPAPAGPPRPGPAGPAPTVRRAPPPPAALQGPLAVQIGAFREPARARELAETARRAGFAPVRVSATQDEGGALYLVRVGVYATAEDARSAGERLERALGVACRVVPAP